MKSLVLISAVLLQLNYARGHSSGAGAFSSQDSTGKRYGGTYGLEDGKVVDKKGTFPPDFTPPDFTKFAGPDFTGPDFAGPDFAGPDFAGPDFAGPDFAGPDFTGPDFGEPSANFFPVYFKNLETLLQEFERSPWFGFPPFGPSSFIGSSFNPFPGFPGFWPFRSPFPRFKQSPSFGFSPFGPSPFGPSPFGPSPFIGSSFDPFSGFPGFHSPFSSPFRRAFQSNLDSQKLALGAAHKSFDLTSNQAAFSPNLNPSRLGPFPAMPNFPKGFPFGSTFSSVGGGAFASAMAGPGMTHQIAALSPENPLNPNIERVGTGSGNPGGMKSVSVSSYSSSSNINGQEERVQGAHTYINDNGKITSYSVHNP